MSAIDVTPQTVDYMLPSVDHVPATVDQAGPRVDQAVVPVDLTPRMTDLGREKLEHWTGHEWERIDSAVACELDRACVATKIASATAATTSSHCQNVTARLPECRTRRAHSKSGQGAPASSASQ